MKKMPAKKVVRKAAKLQKKDTKKVVKALGALAKGKTKKASRKGSKAVAARQERRDLLKDNPVAKRASGPKKRPNSARKY